MKREKEDVSSSDELKGLYDQLEKGEIDSKSFLGNKTDKLVFRLIGDSHIFLSAPFVLEKITKWQRDVDRPDKDISFDAQNNLKKIGTTLARKTKTIPWAVILLKQRVYKKLKEAKVLNLRSEGNKLRKLKELFGDKTIEQIEGIHTTYDEWANAITAVLFKYTEGTVARYCKRSDGHTKLLKKLIL